MLHVVSSSTFANFYIYSFAAEDLEQLKKIFRQQETDLSEAVGKVDALTLELADKIFDCIPVNNQLLLELLKTDLEVSTTGSCYCLTTLSHT